MNISKTTFKTLDDLNKWLRQRKGHSKSFCSSVKERYADEFPLVLIWQQDGNYVDGYWYYQMCG